jgi:hypothetical protein
MDLSVCISGVSWSALCSVYGSGLVDEVVVRVRIC